MSLCKFRSRHLRVSRDSEWRFGWSVPEPFIYWFILICIILPYFDFDIFLAVIQQNSANEIALFQIINLLFKYCWMYAEEEFNFLGDQFRTPLFIDSYWFLSFYLILILIQQNSANEIALFQIINLLFKYCWRYAEEEFNSCVTS